MGKLPYMYTDSEETEDTSSSVENIKKKKKFSKFHLAYRRILKYSSGNVKKKKCEVHSVSEPEETESRTRSNYGGNGGRKLRGILKHDRERESSDDEEEEPPLPPPSKPRSKFLVGRVPRPAGGRAAGLAIVIRKNTDMEDKVVSFDQGAAPQNLQAQSSTSSTKKFHSSKRLAKKRSY